MNQGPNPAIAALIATLSEEKDQDQAATTEDASFLTGIKSGALIRREMEFSDPEKQWVRRQWVRFAEHLHTKLSRPLQYLTLPAYYRLDVTMMLERELLHVDNSDGRAVLSVAAFEADPGKFGLMTGATPEFKLFGQSTLEEALINPKNPYFRDLMRMFPFDIINFDLTTSLTPQHEGPFSRVMQALEEVFKRQAPHFDEWALFVTFRNVEGEWEKNALNAFVQNLQDNLDQYASVRDKFKQTLNVNTAQELLENDPSVAIVQSVGKWLVDRAHHYGHSCISIESYFYPRHAQGVPPYKISKLLMTFRRGTQTTGVVPMKELVPETWMETDLVSCIGRNKHRSVEDILLKADNVEQLIAEVSALTARFEETYTRSQPTVPDADTINEVPPGNQ